MQDKGTRMPSFWTSEEESGCTLLEFIEHAVRTRDRTRFDPKLHRNQGYKGSGSCKVPDCQVCALLTRLGA